MFRGTSVEGGVSVVAKQSGDLEKWPSTSSLQLGRGSNGCVVGTIF